MDFRGGGGKLLREEWREERGGKWRGNLDGKGVKNAMKNVVETSVKTCFGERIPGPCEEWRGKPPVEIF